MATYPAGTHTIGQGQWPYPDGSQPPFPPGDFQNLAARLALLSDCGIGYQEATSGLQSMVTSGDAKQGMVVYTGDTGLYWKFNGTAWVNAAPSVQFSGQTDDFTGGATMGTGAVENSTTQSVTVPNGATAILSVRASAYFYLGTAASWSGYLHLVVNGTRDYGSTVGWRYSSHGRAGALVYTGSWEITLTPGTYTVGVAAVEDTGTTASHEIWDLQTLVTAKW